MLNLVAITILLSNVASGQAATREWNAGDIYVWSGQTLVETAITDNEDGVSTYVRVETDTENKYNLTAIDTVAMEYDAYISTTGGTTFIGGIDYDADDFVEDEVTLPDSMDVDFNWNYETNETVFYDFDFYIAAFELVDPDWVVINNAFAELFNLSEIVDTVTNIYEPTIYNITLGDTFGNFTESRIQGVKNNLPKAIGKFSDSNTKFNFDFDLSGKIYDRVYNGTAGYYHYFAYDIYTITTEFSYSEGGILERMEYQIDYQSTYEDIVTRVTTTMTTVLGTLKSLTGNFAYLAVFPAIGLLAAIVRIKRKK